MSRRNRDGKHRARQLGKPEHSIDLPYEDVPAGPLELDLADVVDEMASGVIIKAVTLPVPDIGTVAALILEFARPDGTRGPRILLVADEDQVLKLPALVEATCKAAVAAARKANG